MTNYIEMHVLVLIILCAVASKDVVAESENEVKRGAFPFMAFLYYPDKTILDDAGARYTRGAILISNNWLISSNDVAISFPEKTLLARLGAVVVDNNFTLNEDEEEQEREIILVMRPYNYSMTEWWYSDISLLKTLLPFNSTASVSPAALVSNPDNTDKTCFILFYAKRSSNATERTLLQMAVELLPSTPENCGTYFKKETMACGGDSEDKPNPGKDPNFCQGNSGGPLICDNELTGLQTYINDCNQPYLYQLLTVWEKLISCAKTEQNLVGSCRDVGVTLTKDPPVSSTPVILLDEIKGSSDVSSSVLIKDETHLVSSINNIEEESIPTTKSETSKATTKENTMPVTHKTSIFTTSYSHDTTSYVSSDLLTDTEENAVDSTEERERKNKIEAQHHLVRGEAFMTTSYLFSYSIISVLVLAYLT